MLLTLVGQPPEGGGWIHEIKYDGYRTLISVDFVRTRAFTRNGHDWTDSYADIVHEAAALACQTAIIDGETVALDEQGRPDFSTLRRAIRSEFERLVYFAFDLLMINGKDLRGQPLRERRARLQTLLDTAQGERTRFSSHLVGNGAEVFAAADRLGLEGIVSKNPESTYQSGRRGRSWLKVQDRHHRRVRRARRRAIEHGIPIALLATRGPAPAYVGNAMITLGGKKRDDFWKRIDALGSPRARLAHLHKRKDAQWVRPGLVATVRHLRGEEKLRHATLLAVRRGRGSEQRQNAERLTH